MHAPRGCGFSEQLVKAWNFFWGDTENFAELSCLFRQ